MKTLTLHYDQDLAMVTIDLQSSRRNVINRSLISEFESLLDRIEQHDGLSAVIIRSGKNNSFIAGTDLNLFSDFKKPGDALAFCGEINHLLNRLSTLSLPVIAAIHGHTAGGGLALALACDYRIATSHTATRFGFPEVTLGLCPGGGGTQRLPEIVGLTNALPLLLTGKNMLAQEALAIGLVDELIHEFGLVDAAKTAARKLPRKSSTRSRKLFSRTSRFFETNPVSRRVILSQAAKAVQSQTRGSYPAPHVILSCVRYGIQHGMEKGIAFEAQMFDQLAMTDESRQLISTCLTRKSARKNPSKARPADVRRIGVLGAGLMGSGITSISIRNGFDVTLKDQDYPSAALGKQKVWKDLEPDITRGILTEQERERMLSGVRLTDNYCDLRHLPLIIEAVFEDLPTKHAVLKEAESVMPEDAVYATNTSAIPIADIAKAAKHPERVIGMHYFSPAQKMPLLEIIKGENTDESAVATACDVGIRQGKYVIVVGDAPGFYVTRMLVPMINEAMLLIEEGADIRIIDTAIMNFGFPVGPVTLVDEAGIDVVSHVNETIQPVFSKRGIRISQAIHRLQEAGFAGKKNRRGFYDYRNRKKLLNEEIYPYFGGAGRKDFSLDDITERITLVMLNEAVYCLQEGILRDPKDGDIGAVMGMGFPAFLGGPFRFIDTQGLKTIWDRLSYRQSLHGGRFKPAQLLADRMKQQKTFHQ